MTRTHAGARRCIQSICGVTRSAAVLVVCRLLGRRVQLRKVLRGGRIEVHTRDLPRGVHFLEPSLRHTFRDFLHSEVFYEIDWVHDLSWKCTLAFLSSGVSDGLVFQSLGSAAVNSKFQLQAIGNAFILMAIGVQLDLGRTAAGTWSAAGQWRCRIEGGFSRIETFTKTVSTSGT